MRVRRSAAMWWVLNAHASKLDDVEATLAAYRGCSDHPLADMCAPHLPWWDRFAVSISLGHLLPFEPGGAEADTNVRRSLVPPATCRDAVSVLAPRISLVCVQCCMSLSG